MKVVVLFAGNVAHGLRGREPFALRRVVPEVIDRLADVAVGLMPRLGALEDHRRRELETALFHQSRRPSKNVASLAPQHVAPGGERFASSRHGGPDVLSRGLRDAADHGGGLSGIPDVRKSPVRDAAVTDQERVGGPKAFAGAGEGGAHPFAQLLVEEWSGRRIGEWGLDCGLEADRRQERARLGAGTLSHRGVSAGIEPRLVRRVLEQAAHEIRHAGNDLPDRNVDAGAVPSFGDGCAQTLGHPVQRLELDVGVVEAGLARLDDRLGD